MQSANDPLIGRVSVHGCFDVKAILSITVNNISVKIKINTLINNFQNRSMHLNSLKIAIRSANAFITQFLVYMHQSHNEVTLIKHP